MTFSNVQALSFALIPGSENRSLLQINFDKSYWMLMTETIRWSRKCLYGSLGLLVSSYVWNGKDMSAQPILNGLTAGVCIGSAIFLFRQMRDLQYQYNFPFSQHNRRDFIRASYRIEDW